MLSFLAFILILSFLILIHEFGHFITAKKMGIAVEEFGLGIPPRIFGKKIGNTIYSINALPFGGFVRLKGEDSLEVSESELHDHENFVSKTPKQRILVILAGVFMNMLLGAVLFYISLGFSDFKTAYLPLMSDYNFKFGSVNRVQTTIFGFDKDSPLSDEALGVNLGQAIVNIDSIPVFSLEDVRTAVKGKEDQSISVTIKNLRSDDAEKTVQVAPYIPEAGDSAKLGVYLGTSAQINYATLPQKAFSGFLHSYNILSYSVSTLGELIGFSIEEKSVEPLVETVSGPIGIYSVVDSIVDSHDSRILLNLIDLMGLISVSLAFLNIMPLPALDGGRAFFILIEGVRGKRFKPGFEANFHKIGILALMSLLVVISIRDITRLFH